MRGRHEPPYPRPVMTKPKYATAEERKAARSVKAKAQMLAQWEQRRATEGRDMPTYSGRHARVRRGRGRAGDQICVECQAPAHHWAHTHGTTGADPEHYRPMCRDCHWIYDDVGQRVAKAAKASGAHAPAARAMWARRTPEERADILARAAATRKANREARRAALAVPLDGAG